MDIHEALIALDGLFDCLYESGFLSDEEADTMNEVEDVICAYVRETSKRQESSFTGC